jgi:hypothetical protein
MMMRSVRAIAMAVLAVGALSAVGCSKDAEVLAFVSEFDTFSNTIVKHVKSAPNVSAGVDAAQKYLDENKGSIQQKMAALKEVKNFQLKAETKKKFEDSVISNAKTVASLPLDYVGQMAMNPGLQAKFEKLLNDYRDTMK